MSTKSKKSIESATAANVEHPVILPETNLNVDTGTPELDVAIDRVTKILEPENLEPAERVRLPQSRKGRDIYATQSELNYKFVTAKKKVQVELSVGKDEPLAHLLGYQIQVSVKAESADGKVTIRHGHLSLATLLVDASNGLFELTNTNSITEQDCIDQWDAQVNGYIYKGDWLASLKKPEFSFPTLYKQLTDVDADLIATYGVTYEQLAQWQALVKQLNFKGVMAHQTKLHDSDKWTWLAAIMDDLGYIEVVEVDEKVASLF